MKATHGEIQHALVVADIDRKETRNAVRKISTEKREKLAERFKDQETILRKIN